MATHEFKLASPPKSERARELWLQHAAGFILFEDVRAYAREKIDPALSSKARAAVEKGIDDAMYGLMMIIDGVTGGIENGSDCVDLRFLARHTRRDAKGDEVLLKELDLAQGDGFCMGIHGWREGDFGKDPIVVSGKK